MLIQLFFHSVLPTDVLHVLVCAARGPVRFFFADDGFLGVQFFVSSQVRYSQLDAVKRQPMNEAVFVYLDDGNVTVGVSPVADICDGETNYCHFPRTYDNQCVCVFPYLRLSSYRCSVAAPKIHLRLWATGAGLPHGHNGRTPIIVPADGVISNFMENDFIQARVRWASVPAYDWALASVG